MNISWIYSEIANPVCVRATRLMDQEDSALRKYSLSVFAALNGADIYMGSVQPEHKKEVLAAEDINFIFLRVTLRHTRFKIRRTEGMTKS